MELALKILAGIGTMWTVLHAYYFIVLVVGVFARKKYGETERRFHYGICIAGRNEEKVIGNLLDSIARQDYPQEKLSVFVCADNCTDRTAEIVREFAKTHPDMDVNVTEHRNPAERTKGYALRYLFDRIREERGIDCCDGYFVFDADNILAGDYVSRMNESFAAGEKIVCSLRQSKNTYKNWISYSYAMHWLATSVCENRGKSLLRLSCRIQGTGFLFAKELVKDGWNYVTLTEDRAFYADATVSGYVVAYNEAAVFYDEQPESLKIAFRQRIRWSKGHLQAGVQYCPKLLKNIFSFNRNTPRSFECFMTNAPRALESDVRKLLSWALKIAVGAAAANVWGAFWGILTGIGASLATDLLTSWLYYGAVAVYYRKSVPGFRFGRSVFLAFFGATFGWIGTVTLWIALFKKVEWKEIPHSSVMEPIPVGAGANPGKDEKKQKD